ncbi:MAG: alpha/beta fold hydrolase [Reyranellales bacterium]
MPLRRRRAERPPRPWPLYLLFLLGALAGAALWAYAPDLPKDVLIERYANEHSTFIDVGGVRAHVRDEGKPDGIPIVLIHGSLGSLHMWEGWVRELKDRARLISVDLPGHGLTGAWPRDEYTIEAYTDFIEVLADTLNLDRFVVAGQSMGGAVAWSFAATRPERVSQLILVDAAGYPRDGPAPLPMRLARMPVVGDIGIYFKPERIVRRSLSEVFVDQAKVTPALINRYAELQRFPGNRQATLMRARTQEPLDPTPLKRLDVPTLIIWGAKDRWVPVADAFRFQGDIKGAKLAIFENLGHNSMEEDPAATAAAVRDFLPETLTPPNPAPAPVAPAPVDRQTDQIPPPDDLPPQDQVPVPAPAQQEPASEDKQTVAPAAEPAKEKE